MWRKPPGEELLLHLEGDLLWHHGAFSGESLDTFLVSEDFLGGSKAGPNLPFPVPVRHPQERISLQSPCSG